MLPAYAPDPQARVHTFCHAVPGTWHAMGVMLSAAGSAAWLRGALGAPYAELDAEAERWEPGAEGLLFAPYLAGERTPYADPDARGAFTGLSLRHDRGALWRAMLEGVAFGLRDSLELLRELGARPEVGRVSGGGARSELWLRIVASVLQLPLERMETEEGSAFGAALLAGIRSGTFADADEAVARCVRRAVARRARLGLRRAVPALPLPVPRAEHGADDFVGSSLFPAAPAGPTVGGRVQPRRRKEAPMRRSPAIRLARRHRSRRCSSAAPPPSPPPLVDLRWPGPGPGSTAARTPGKFTLHWRLIRSQLRGTITLSQAARVVRHHRQA